MAVAFASQKQHLALYICDQEIVDGFRNDLSAASIGKGCIRYKKPENMGFDTIERLLLTVRKSLSE